MDPGLAAAYERCRQPHRRHGILDEVERAGYDVFARRATVPKARRLRIAARCLLTPAGTAPEARAA